MAAILRLPASEGLARIVADYREAPGISLVGEADAAREWVDDAARNHKGQSMSLAFFRRWLQREVESTCARQLTRASPRAQAHVANGTSRAGRGSTGTVGAGPPAIAGPDQYEAFVRRRAAEVLQQARQGKESRHEATS